MPWMSDRNEDMGDPRTLLTTGALAVVVFVSGASVMIYEFVAVRFLQRSFGSLLDVWACEIAICMAGLAFGYAIGGMLADRLRSWPMLGVVLLVAALTALPMETLAVSMGDWMLEREEAWWHPLAAASSSFLPLLALGTIMPQAVRLYVRRLEGVGAATGWMAFTSTSGSIVGVLLTTMKFFPKYGVVETLFGTSAVLGGLGVMVLLVSGGLRWSRRAIPAAVLVLAVGGAAAAQDVIFEKYSAYHHILVVDSGDERSLRFDNTRQSIMLKSNPYAGGFEYLDFFHLPVMLNPGTESALFIGLGGGTGPKAFLKDYPRMRIEVAEIDPMVVQVARDFFALPDDPRLKIYMNDGRMHLRRSKKTFGIIFMDAYGVGRYGASIPFHLVTREFFEIARKHLNHGGSLVYNVMGTHAGHNAQTIAGVHATLAEVFDTVYMFEAGSSANTVFVAQKLDPPDPNAATPKAWPESPWLDAMLSADDLSTMAQGLLREGVIKLESLPVRLRQLSKGHGAAPSGPIFTDNYAPVDVSPGLRKAN